jgi:DNA-binding transcriptional regulator YdaS (Cro superfamily)
MKLKAYLKKTGFTRREFGDNVGLTEAMVSRICTGNRCPSAEPAAAIVKFTRGQVTLADLNPRLAKLTEWRKRHAH